MGIPPDGLTQIQFMMMELMTIGLSFKLLLKMFLFSNFLPKKISMEREEFMISMEMVLRTTSRDQEMSLMTSTTQTDTEMPVMMSTTPITETSLDMSNLRITRCHQEMESFTNSLLIKNSIPTLFSVDPRSEYEE